MPIEKLDFTGLTFAEDAHIKFRMTENKINELIDFINTSEQDRLEHMARYIERIMVLETQMSRVIDYINENEERLKELENATHPTEEETILGCPWCVTNENIENDAYSKKEYILYCHKCGSCGPIAKTQQEAINAWNKRA